MNKNTHFEGPPDVVVEVRSPDDESYDKLPFYAKLGVAEVWIIDRDTKRPEIYALRVGEYEKKIPAADGWLQSEVTGVEMRPTGRGKLSMCLGKDESTREDLPED